MKKFLFALCFMFSFGFLTSCSVDELDQNGTNNLDKMSNSDNSYSVYGKDDGVIVNDTTSAMTTDMPPPPPTTEIDPPKPAPKPE